MKRFTAILLSAFILLSGGSISYSTHFCGGKLAEAKWTFGQQASCGMKKQKGCPVHKIKSNCCKNQDYKYEVDGTYSPSATLKPDCPISFIMVEFPVIQWLSYTPSTVLLPTGKPPLVCERLCVFRI